MKMIILKRASILFFVTIILALPVTVKADAQAEAIWGIGVQLGFAEIGANQGVSTSTLSTSLRYARDFARTSTCISDTELESLRVAMTRTRNSKTLFSRIQSYRIRLTSDISRNCSCNGSGSNAQGLYGVGVQIGFAELGSYLGIPSSTLYQSFQYAIDSATRSGCVPTNELVGFRNSMRNARSSKTFYSQIQAYRIRLGNYVRQNCSCNSTGGQSSCRNISGRWRQNTSGFASSYWTFVSIGGNRYRATETGSGNATGTAVLNQRRLRLDASTGNQKGYYIWNLNRNCSSGTGKLTFTRGRRGTYSSTITRVNNGGGGINNQILSVKTRKNTYSPNERIVVDYAGLPTSTNNWITIVRTGTRAGSFGQRFYTQRRRSGAFTFRGLAAGNYEVRLHYPRSNSIRARYRFTVSGTTSNQGNCRASDWAGTWNTTFNRMELRLLSNGSLSGTYNTAKHYISGSVSTNNPCIFIGTWRHRNSNNTGRIRFVMKPNRRQFEGTYTYGNTNPAGKGVNWKGTKK